MTTSRNEFRKRLGLSLARIRSFVRPIPYTGNFEQRALSTLCALQVSLCLMLGNIKQRVHTLHSPMDKIRKYVTSALGSGGKSEQDPDRPRSSEAARRVSFAVLPTTDSRNATGAGSGEQTATSAPGSKHARRASMPAFVGPAQLISDLKHHAAMNKRVSFMEMMHEGRDRAEDNDKENDAGEAPGMAVPDGHIFKPLIANPFATPPSSLRRLGFVPLDRVASGRSPEDMDIEESLLQERRRAKRQKRKSSGGEFSTRK
ncbi:hypothetical protein B0H10DRAFT_2067747 [Mycena sp. CBHHK59/15]|nr:hypothetical protein B0H10DRAFT_2067747 [Mycena sp. CBHHK59/15]